VFESRWGHHPDDNPLSNEGGFFLARVRQIRRAAGEERALAPDRGQREGEAAAPTHGGFHPDGAAVVLDDFLADGEPETGSLVLVGDGVAAGGFVEFLEQVGQVRFGDAGPGVADRRGHGPRGFRQGDGDRTLLGELVGVVQEIDDHLLDFVRVRVNGFAGRGQVHLDPDVGVGREAARRRRDRLSDDFARVDEAVVPRRLAGLDAVDVQEVVDQARQPFAFRVDDRQVVPDAGRLGRQLWGDGQFAEVTGEIL